MLPITQRLAGCRRLCPLYHHQHLFHHHYRLYNSTVTTDTESEGSTDPADSFGCLAAKKQKSTVIKESSIRFQKPRRGFTRPTSGFTNPLKGFPGHCEDSTLEKWKQFKDTEYQEILARWGEGQKDDTEEYYQHFITGRATRVAKGSVSKGGEESLVKPSGASIPQEPLDEKDTFGRLAPQEEEAEGDEGDEREERYQEAKLRRRHRPHFYGFKMKKLCKEGKLAEAIKILEEEMPAAGTKPDDFCYQVLINACGRAGYTKKAFKFYNQMKKCGLKVEHVAYTGLFNACAHSPWPTTDGLDRATHLRTQLKEKGYHFNQIVSHVMIKAFGRCGDMNTAFLVVDEMVENGVLVTTETINFLLQACITNREAGFRYALKVWRKMRELRLQPDIYSYNLLVRLAKDCGAGDPRLTSALLKEEYNHQDHANSRQKASCKKKQQQHFAPQLLDIEGELIMSEECSRDPSEESHVVQGENIVELEALVSSNAGVLPSILGKKLTSGDVVALGPLDKPQDRLALLGGSHGILRQMTEDRVTPNMKTLTQLLDCIPSDTPSEEALLESIKNLGLEPDTQFFNMLIRRRNFRYDTEAAKDVISLMQDHHLSPDLITFGCLALGCRSTHTATQMFRDMDEAQFSPNLEIMTMLVKNSLFKRDLMFTVAMMKEMKLRNIAPDHHLLSVLERARAQARDTVLGKVHTREHQDSERERDRRKKSAHLFLAAYKAWLKESQVQLPEHPWTQYQ